MFNKKHFLSFISLFLLFALVGCFNQSNNNDSEDTSVTKLRSEQDIPYIGFAMDTLQDERWYRDKDYFEQKVQSLGGNVKTLAANGIHDVQVEQVELLIEEGIDILVIIPADSEASAEIVELAHQADVPVISYDKLVLNADLDYYISFDNVKVGELQASAILEEVDEGDFAYVGGADNDNNAHLFKEGAMNVLQPYIDSGDINLVYDQFTPGWSPDEAEAMFGSFLENNQQVDAVVAANDGTAGGVIQALNAQNLTVPISGQDAELDAIRRIQDGTQTMTVYKSLEQIAETAAETAMRLANGETIETDSTMNNNNIDVPSILLDPITITSNNIDETVIADGHIDADDL
ncbi:sugar ABC transporter substrate-binding protein [Amphibacillus cookii]|uniref:sugar ABC transporter substrate-binding protein n=1 Tax=Amphibacillus cookii TaxID=767787 RepID=UPI00195AEF80|nr:substrate-binding domain-containing protein [Amphibacillus cookii]MBM7542858.1 simple sugar transport system substrate-binding protein/D-xylose transport system substrate-binding protein [Amphibacillus cookii]